MFLEVIWWKSLVFIFEDNAYVVGKNLEILKLHYHFKDRNWLCRDSYGGHTLISLKSTRDWTFYIVFFFKTFLYVWWFIVKIWEKKLSQTHLGISKMSGENPMALMSVRWRLKYLFCLWASLGAYYIEHACSRKKSRLCGWQDWARDWVGKWLRVSGTELFSMFFSKIINK